MEPAANRLKVAIDRAKKEKRSSINHLSQALKAQGIAGASYGSVRNYYHGRSRPPVPLLEAAAPILGVRPEWLARGEGEPTEPEQRQHQKSVETPEWLLEPVSAEFPVYTHAPEWARGLVKRTHYECTMWALLGPMPSSTNLSLGPLKEKTHEEVDEYLARRIGEALAGPLKVLEADPTDLSTGQLGDYILHMSQALRALFAGSTGVGGGPPIVPKPFDDPD